MRVLLGHFAQLAFLKAISRVLPLITIPFLVRTIGVCQYGTLEFVKSLSFYFTTLISYGFQYSSTRDISQHRDDKKTIGTLLGAVYTIKLAAILASCVIMGLLIYWVPSIRQVESYCWAFLAVVTASALFPVFVFQGLDKMKWATILNLIGKLLYLVSIFVFVRRPSDAILVPLLLALTDTIRLVLSCTIVYYVFDLRLHRPTWSLICAQIREGWHLFFSQLSIIFYTPLPAIFLGFFIGPDSVAIYSLGDKIVRTTITMIDPFTRALFPIASKRMLQNPQAGLQFITKMACMSLLVLLFISLSYWILAPRIMGLLTVNPVPEAVYIFRLHAFLPCFIIVSSILGMAGLIPAGVGSRYTLTMVMAGLICTLLHFILVPGMEARGAAWSMLICEIFATLMLIFWTLQTYRKAVAVGVS
ncbi:MAG: oligosaccharide flippase family protein [Bacteroidota bacterium]